MIAFLFVFWLILALVFAIILTTGPVNRRTFRDLDPRKINRSK